MAEKIIYYGLMLAPSIILIIFSYFYYRHVQMPGKMKEKKHLQKQEAVDRIKLQVKTELIKMLKKHQRRRTFIISSR